MHKEQHYAEVTPQSNQAASQNNTPQGQKQQPPQGQQQFGMQNHGMNAGADGMQGGMGQQQPAAGTNPYYQTQNPNPYYQVQGADPYYQMQSNPYHTQQSPNPISSYLGGINTTQLLTGALIGAAATYVLTNETVQKKLFKGIAAMSDILSGGMDEIKERYEDAKAEYEAGKGS